MSIGDYWDSGVESLNDALNLYGKYEGIRTGSALSSAEEQNPVSNNGVVRPAISSVSNDKGGTMNPGDYEGEKIAGMPKTAVIIGGALVLAFGLYMAVR